MAGLKFALGMIPDTAKVESANDNLRKDYVDYIEYEKSDDLKHFQDLETEIKSADFASRKKEIHSRKFQTTNEYKKEKEFLSLDKSKAIKNYFKIKDSQNLSGYLSYKNSDKPQQIIELENFLKSDAFLKPKSEIKPKEFKKSEEAAKEKQFLSIKKSSDYKKFIKFENSSSYKEYLRIKDSEELKKHADLKAFINSAKFKEVKDYMNLPSKKKYELSEEYKKETEFNNLIKSEKVIWYKNIKKKYPFKEIEKWDLSFEENFDTDKIDSSKWMFRYLNGDKIMKKAYVMADDIHAFVEGKNLQISSGKLSIFSRKEEAKGLSWSPVFGFIEKEYHYTSDMISTAKSFNQKEGIFKAKVKLGNTGVSQAFSLMSDQMLPHADVFKLENNKLFAGNFWRNGSKNGISKSISKTSGNRYCQDYHIFSLEWTENKMIWKINDLVFKVQSQGLPEKEMHLCFSASLKETAKNLNLPSKMDIDWIRVYKKK